MTESLGAILLVVLIVIGIYFYIKSRVVAEQKIVNREREEKLKAIAAEYDEAIDKINDNLVVARERVKEARRAWEDNARHHRGDGDDNE